MHDRVPRDCATGGFYGLHRTALAVGNRTRWRICVGHLSTWALGGVEPDGTLLRVFGNGGGQGPGEFTNMNGLLVGTDSVVNVFTGRAEWHRYHWSGEYLETVRAPTMSGVAEPVVLADGMIVTVAMRPEGPVLVTWNHGRAAEFVETKVEPGFHRLVLGASRSAGLWSSETPSYVLRRHQMPQGNVGFEIRREAPWFRREHGRSPYVTHVTVDERGLVWICTNVPDSSPPAGPPVETFSDEARRHQNDQYRDVVMEVFTPDGRLLASRRFDDLAMTGWGLAGDLWVLQEDDLLQSLVIRRAMLVQN